MDRFQYNLAGMFLWWPSTKFVQAVMIRQKTWPLGGGAYFPYIAIWNILKIFLSETTGPISIWQNWSFGDPLSRFSSSHHDAWKKNMAAGEQGYKIYTKILEQWTWLKLQQ